MRAAIEEAARVVRENIEAFAVHAAKVYGAEIAINTNEAGEMYLMGACAIASRTLWRALVRAGFKDAVFVKGWYYETNHCWVEVDGQVVDITATQFGAIAPVVFRPIEGALGYEKTRERYGHSLNASLNADAERLTGTWIEGQSPLDPRYRFDLEVIEGLALDAALEQMTIDELDNND